MIIEDLNSFPILGTKLVDLWPSTKERSEGVLRVATRDYPVKVTYEPDKRVWARVVVAKELDAVDMEDVALKVAAKGLADEMWRPLCVDPRDGETLYSTTLTYDLTSDAIDRFLDQAIRFLEERGDEVDDVLGRGSSSDDQPIDLGGFDFSSLI